MDYRLKIRRRKVHTGFENLFSVLRRVYHARYHYILGFEGFVLMIFIGLSMIAFSGHRNRAERIRRDGGTEGRREGGRKGGRDMEGGRK